MAECIHTDGCRCRREPILSPKDAFRQCLLRKTRIIESCPLSPPPKRMKMSTPVLPPEDYSALPPGLESEDEEEDDSNSHSCSKDDSDGIASSVESPPPALVQEKNDGSEESAETVHNRDQIVESIHLPTAATAAEEFIGGNSNSDIPNHSNVLAPLKLNDRVVISFSGFKNDEQNKLLNRFDGCNKWVIRRQLDDIVTHLVVKSYKSKDCMDTQATGSRGKETDDGTIDKNDQASEWLLCERTPKFIQAMAKMIPVVNSHWLEDCFTKNDILPEDNYIINGDTVIGFYSGPKNAFDQSRMTRKNRILCGYSFVIRGEVGLFKSLKEVEKLITDMGGSVLKQLKDIDAVTKDGQKCMIICQPHLDQKTYDTLHRRYRVPIIDVHYVAMIAYRFSLLEMNVEDFSFSPKKSA